jgi:single stranded DNA-binding protein
MVNKLVLVGRMASEGVEVRPLSEGKHVGNFLLAVDRGFRKDSGVDFYRVVVWNGTAVNAEKYLRQGDMVSVVGHLRTSSYEKQCGSCGTAHKVRVVELHADEVGYLTPPSVSKARATGGKGRAA